MESERTKQRPNSAVGAAISGLILGGGSVTFPAGAWIGAAGGAIYLSAVESITDIRRQPGDLKPLAHRIVANTLVGSALAVALAFIFDGLTPALAPFLMGLLAGALGLGPRKIALGLVLGLLGGVLQVTVARDLTPALTGGGVVLVFRLLLVALFRQNAILENAGEQVPTSEARFVVPFDVHTGYVGIDYMQTLARETDGTFRRNQPDIGIIETMESLAGPTFDPSLVDPLIREFYEHTTRFKLSIVPVWNPLMRPFFWLFKTLVAERIGQANIPVNTSQAQHGVVSYVDTIDFQTAEATATNIRTLRGWVRAYEATQEAIYVGVYTIVRHKDEGYVSVGFPLPEANFTATLLPYNSRGSGFLLKTRGTGRSFPGHYLTYIEHERQGDDALTILRLSTMQEEIDVYVEDGELKTDHRFYFDGFRFLNLYYSITRKSVAG